jgi:protein-disulfide isomerase
MRMSVRDNFVPFLLGIAVCGAVVAGGLVIQSRRASTAEAPVQSTQPNVQPAVVPPPAAADANAPRPIANWEQYIPTGRLVGPRNAPLTLVEFADFQCPACKTLHDQLKALQAEYPGVLAISYHYVPLPYHTMAYPAARAAECAADQGRFEQYYDKLFENTHALDQVSFSGLAFQAGVPDVKKFDACAAKTEPVKRIDDDRNLAMGTLQIRGTPTVIVNGQMYFYAPKMPALRQMIEEARARAGKP